MPGNDVNTNLLLHANGGSGVKSAFGHVKMNEVSGTNVADSGSGANTFTASTDTSNLTVAGKGGPLNTAFDFTAASSEYINVDTLRTDVTADTIGSISVWLKKGNGTSGWIFSLGNSATATALNVFWSSTGTDFRVGLTVDPTDYWNCNGANTVATGEWHHLVITHDGIAPKIYTDGVEGTTFSITTDKTKWVADLTGSNYGRIGCINQSGGGNALFMDGEMDDFRYFRCVLSQTEIDALYASGSGTETSIIVDSSVSGGHTAVQTFNDAQLDEGAGFIQTVPDDSSFSEYAEFNGTSSYFSVPDHADWDVVGSNADSWTIDLWVKHTDHAATEAYMSQYQGAADYWWLGHSDSSNGIAFQAETTAGGVIVNTGYAGEINDTNWHHVAMCKVASEYAIYLDGAQVNYVSAASVGTFAADLYLGVWDGAGSPLFRYDGRMDEVRIQNSNAFSATPVVGLSDTITVPVAPHTSDANTHLLLHLDGNADDSGNTTHTVTPANITYGVGSKWNNASLKFDGTGDYVTIPDSADWNIVTPVGSQTIDLQAAFNTHAGTDFLMEQWSGAAANRWHLTHTDGSGLQFQIVIGGSNQWSWTYSGLGEITDSNWHHIAMIKVGTFYAVYLDGNQIGIAWSPATADYTGTLEIGQFHGASNYFDGNMDEIRVQADNYFLAAPNSYPAASVLFKGETGLKNSCGEMNGISDYFTAPDHADWDFDSGDFTIDFWAKFDDVGTATREDICGQRVDVNNRWYIGFNQTGAGTPGKILIEFNSTSGGVGGLRFRREVDATLVGAWHHFAFVRNGSNLYMFLDGSEITDVWPGDIVADAPNVASLLYVGAMPLNSYYMDGTLDEFRISKGIARWTTDFTPPTEKYESDANTSLLLHMDEPTLTTDSGNTGHTITNNGVDDVISNYGYSGGPPANPRGTFAGTCQTNPIDFCHMRMEDNTDQGTGGNIVTNIGTPTYTSGHLNNALTLDGSTDALNVDALEVDIDTDTAGTISVWEYHTASGTIFCMGNSAANTMFRFDVSVNRVGLYHRDNPTEGINGYTDASSLPASQWNHIAVVQDGVDIKVYINGSEVTFTNNGTGGSEWFSGLTGSNVGRIGCTNYNSGGNTNFFTGQIDDFRYYQNMALSQFQINHIYNEGNGTQRHLQDIYFDGNSDYITLSDPSGTSYDVVGSATDSWTIDVWICPTTLSAQKIVEQYESASDRWDLDIGATGICTFFVTSSVVTWTGAQAPAGSIIAKAWQHVAMVKSGANYGIYVNGIQLGYAYEADTDTFTGSLIVGRYGGGSGYFNGYMEQVQITRGNKFGIVPSEAQLLIDFDGADAATTHTATTGQTVSFFVNAQLDNTASVQKFGSACLSLDATSYVTVPTSTDYDFGTGDWTIDGWWKWSDVSGTQYLVNRFQDVNNFMTIIKNSGGAGHTIDFTYRQSGTYEGLWTQIPSWTPGSGWNHIAFGRIGSDPFLFINGVKQAILVNTAYGTLGAITGALSVGYTSLSTRGWVDDFRITKGVALWTSDFTVPDAAVDIYGPYGPGDTNTDIIVPTAVLTQDTITEPTAEYAPVAPPAVPKSQAVIIA